MLSGLSVIGQASKNPFDLTYKKPQADTKIRTNVLSDSLHQSIHIDSTAMVATSPEALPSHLNQSAPTTDPSRPIGSKTNPFDIIRAPIADSDSKINAPKVTQSIEEDIQEEDNFLKDRGFMFWVLFGLLLVFSSIFGAAKGILNQISSSFLNENFLRQTHRSSQNNFSSIYIILYTLALLNVAIFIYLLCDHFDWERPNSILFLLKMAGVVGLIFIGKHLLLSIVGYIFPIQKELSLYNFTIMVFGILIGLLLLPINIVIAFAPIAIGKVIVYLALGAIIAIYLFRIIRGLSIGSKYLVLHKFHFFIYLCTVEILPVIVLLKILDNYTGISFI